MNSILVALRMWAILILGLHLLAYRLPQDQFWGVWAYSFLPPWLAWLLAIGAACLVIPAWNRRLGAFVARIWAAIPGKQHSRLWFIGLAGLHDKK